MSAPERKTLTVPCACGHLSNRHNALVTGRCQHVGCDCPDYRAPGLEHAFALEPLEQPEPTEAALNHLGSLARDLYLDGAMGFGWEHISEAQREKWRRIIRAVLTEHEVIRNG